MRDHTDNAPATGVRSMAIDIAFDFRTDAYGQDPDSYSPMLRQQRLALYPGVG